MPMLRDQQYARDWSCRDDKVNNNSVDLTDKGRGHKAGRWWWVFPSVIGGKVPDCHLTLIMVKFNDDREVLTFSLLTWKCTIWKWPTKKFQQL